MKTTTYQTFDRKTLERALCMAILNEDQEAIAAADRLLALFEEDPELQSVALRGSTFDVSPSI